MVLGWFKRRRRLKLIAEPMPAHWCDALERHVSIYHKLSQEDQGLLCDLIRVFIAEKTWEGCGGLELTDEMKVVIAAQACLLLLHIDHDFYPRMTSILVYPTGYFVPRDADDSPFVVEETSVATLGQTSYIGPVILSWDDARHGAMRMDDGTNLVYHEFAHQLDATDGVFDGTPPLRSKAQYERWTRVMTREYDQLVQQSQRGRASLLDQYGAENPAEFFAVATECFFERPTRLKRRHPELYDLLMDYYQQNPASWFDG